MPKPIITLLSPYILVVPKATQRRIMEMRKKKIKRNMFKKPLLTFYTKYFFKRMTSTYRIRTPLSLLTRKCSSHTFFFCFFLIYFSKIFCKNLSFTKKKTFPLPVWFSTIVSIFPDVFNKSLIHKGRDDDLRRTEDDWLNRMIIRNNQ